MTETEAVASSLLVKCQDCKNKICSLERELNCNMINAHSKATAETN